VFLRFVISGKPLKNIKIKKDKKLFLFMEKERAS
jgi:hypothetical protein